MDSDRIDEQIRLLNRVDEERLAASWPTEPASQALLTEVMTMPAQPLRRPRRTVLRVALAATILALLTAGTAIALNRVSESTIGIGCWDGAGGVTIMKGLSGDPIADCEVEWRRSGQEPPPLAAYDNARGAIEVVPQDVEPPAGWVALDPDFAQDIRVLELEDALLDIVDGVRSACHDHDAATVIAQAELDRLGLEGWTIVVRESFKTADGQRTCAYPTLDPLRRQVQFVQSEVDGSPRERDTEPLRGYLDRLLAALDDCLALPEAGEVARQLAADLGIPEAFDVREIADDAAGCTRVDIDYGGRYFIHLRGPSTP